MAMHDQQQATETPVAGSAGMVAEEPVPPAADHGASETAQAGPTVEADFAEEQVAPPQPDELEQQRQLAMTYLDQLQRLQAEFQNYRRRVTQERQQATTRGKEDVLRALLPILANLHLAVQHAEQDANAVRQGVQMIWQQCEGFLREQGLERVTTVGEPFDPQRHEVLSVVPATAEMPANTVVSEIKAGYFLDGRLLCPAQVIVAQATETSPAAAAQA
jgi:molecular chaperone GrpE